MKLHPATLEFLKAIKQHNSRKYFATVKDLYQEIWKTLQDIATELIEEAKKQHNQFEDTQSKDCLFRIYRDARRLKEGDLLYKTNFGIHVAPGGKKSQLPSYYLHIQPSGESLFCAGLYRPGKTQLDNLRRYIAKHGEEYNKIVNSKTIKNTFGKLGGDILKKTPKGFDENNKRIEYIKMKQHMFIVSISDKEILNTDITTLCKKYMCLVEERMEFLYRGMEYKGE